MSHIVKGKANLKNLQDIGLAAQRLGGELVIGQQTYEWFQRWVGDSPMPEGMTKDDLGKCDHVIRFKDKAYEVGVVRSGDGYELRYDFWQSGGLSMELGGQLGQAYAAVRATRAAKQKGQRVREVVMSDGSIQLEIEEGGRQW